MVNKEFMAKKNELIKKYWESVVGISNENNVDIGVAFEMLLANARNRNTEYPVYVGAGEIDYKELDKDIAELDATRRV